MKFNLGLGIGSLVIYKTYAQSPVEHYCFSYGEGHFRGNHTAFSMTLIASGSTWNITPTIVTAVSGSTITQPTVDRVSNSSNIPTATVVSSSTISTSSIGTRRNVTFENSTPTTASNNPTQLIEGATLNTSSATRALPAPSMSTLLSGSPLNEPQVVSNTTLSLSSAEKDALELALFLKNLGVSLFSLDVRRLANTAIVTSEFADLIANISEQEKVQRTSLQTILRRAGGEDISPCQYNFPTNATEIISLMHTVKVMEIGLQLTRTGPLASADRTVDTFLFSIASIAARQDALIWEATGENVRLTSFETRLSEIWAYNLALGFTHPGTCARELPITILPMLSLNNKTTGFARAGESITFGWDVAAKVALEKSGKPLFIGWVNQANEPLYTSLIPVGDALGVTEVPSGMLGTALAVLTSQTGLEIKDLSDATLAGPVIMSIV